MSRRIKKVVFVYLLLPTDVAENSAQEEANTAYDAARCLSFPRGRSWSKSYIAKLPPHSICRKEGALRENEVIVAVQRISWHRQYQGFRPRALFPGAPVFPLAAVHERRHDVEPEIVPIYSSSDANRILDSSREIVGVNISCEACLHSGLPELVPAILPRDLLRGRSFLEVASLDGSRCLWAEESGASEVVCSDYHGWGGTEDANTHGFRWREAANRSNSIDSLPRGYGETAMEVFQLTRCLTKSKVKALRINVYDLSADLLEVAVGRRGFDVVYAGGLIYHLKHPILGFEALADVTSGVLLFETEVLKPPSGTPEEWHKHGIQALPYARGDHETHSNEPPNEAALCRWFREGELLGDSTNFWTCTAEAYASMLRSVGFQFVHDVGIELFPGLRASPWRDRRVLAAAKTRQGDLRIVRSFPHGRVRY